MILDTESTMCLRRRRRLLVAIAYEVIWPDRTPTTTKNDTMAYDVVILPDDLVPDRRSEEIHGITGPVSWEIGRPLHRVLARLFHCLQVHRPVAIVGHDVVGDAHLVVSEAMLAGCTCQSIPNALMRLICTRMIATPRCALPLPTHLQRQRQRRGVGVAGVSGFKWPSLTETYDMLVLRDGTPARRRRRLHHPTHDARGDVERCREVFLRMVSATHHSPPLPIVACAS